MRALAKPTEQRSRQGVACVIPPARSAASPSSGELPSPHRCAVLVRSGWEINWMRFVPSSLSRSS